jgi:hypothetical protein
MGHYLNKFQIHPKTVFEFAFFIKTNTFAAIFKLRPAPEIEIKIHPCFEIVGSPLIGLTFE